jgi:hypothetical protein
MLTKFHAVSHKQAESLCYRHYLIKDIGTGTGTGTGTQDQAQAQAQAQAQGVI